MPWPLFGQFDGGETMDFFSGILAMQTFKKLPILAPIKKEKPIKNQKIFTILPYYLKLTIKTGPKITPFMERNKYIQIHKGTSINSGWAAKWIEKIKFKAKIIVNSRSIYQIFNAKGGFFKRLDAIHELLEVTINNRQSVSNRLNRGNIWHYQKLV